MFAGLTWGHRGHPGCIQKEAVMRRQRLAGCPESSNKKKKKKKKSFGKSRREGTPEWKCSNPTASMTDAEAQSAPPSAPVEDQPPPERKVIGGWGEGPVRLDIFTTLTTKLEFLCVLQVRWTHHVYLQICPTKSAFSLVFFFLLLFYFFFNQLCQLQQGTTQPKSADNG